MKHVVDISDMKISDNREDQIITYALGSCLGLTIIDPQHGIGGMLHCMMPLSSIDPAKARINPCMFTDLGVIMLLNKLLEMGADKSRLIVKAAGCSKILDDKGLFNIGERNYTVMRKILWKNNILINSENIGGTASRTITLHMDSCKTMLKIAGEETEL